MTIRPGTHITTGKRHHATVQRQAPPPLAPMTTGTTQMARATPCGRRNGPGAARKTSARPCQPLPATAPGPRQITGSNPLPP